MDIREIWIKTFPLRQQLAKEKKEGEIFGFQEFPCLAKDFGPTLVRI